MFNGWQSPASIQLVMLIHSNRLNHELSSEPSFPAPQLYLLRHTLRMYNIFLSLLGIVCKNINLYPAREVSTFYLCHIRQKVYYTHLYV